MPSSDGDCRDCGKYSGELYMLRNKIWKSVGLTSTDRICLACLSKRLGRPFMASDFTRRFFATARSGESWLQTKHGLKWALLNRRRTALSHRVGGDLLCSFFRFLAPLFVGRTLAQRDLIEGAPFRLIRTCEYRENIARETFSAMFVITSAPGSASSVT
jgi:hypothetical protein